MENHTFLNPTLIPHVRIYLICLILELYDFHNIININMRTLIHEDLFFNMLIKDDHKTGFSFFTFFSLLQDFLMERKMSHVLG